MSHFTDHDTPARMEFQEMLAELESGRPQTAAMERAERWIVAEAAALRALQPWADADDEAIAGELLRRIDEQK